MDDFDEDTDDPCVGIEDGSCVFCKTAATIEKSQPHLFHKHPAASIFDVDLSPSKELQFWEDLSRQCNIQKRTFAPEAVVFLPPNLKQAEEDYNKLRDYMMKHKLESSVPYLTAMLRIIAMSPNIEHRVAQVQESGENIEHYDSELRMRMTGILVQSKWPCTQVHEPRVLPYVLSLILRRMSQNKKDNIKSFLQSIKVSAEACAEALFQKIADAMEKHEVKQKRVKKRSRARKITAIGMASKMRAHIMGRIRINSRTHS